MNDPEKMSMTHNDTSDAYSVTMVAGAGSDPCSDTGIRSGGIQIFVKTLTGEIIILDFEASDKVETVKAKIQDVAGINADRQCSACEDKQLKDDSTPSDTNFQKESTFEVLVRIERKLDATLGVNKLVDDHKTEVASRRLERLEKEEAAKEEAEDVEAAGLVEGRLEKWFFESGFGLSQAER